MIRSTLTAAFLLLFFTLTAQLNREEVQVILDKQFLTNLKIEDLDGDGDQDVVVFRKGTKELFYNRRIGNGEFFEEIRYTQPAYN